MRILSWLRGLDRRGRAARRESHRRTLGGSAFRARFEQLEPRRLLTTVSASLATAVITEGSTAAFTFTRDNTAGDLVVNYRVGGSTSAADFSNALTGTATILNGQTSVVVNANTVNDGVLEPAETLTLALLNSSSYTLGAVNQATALVLDANGGQTTYHDLLVGPGQTYATVAAANAAAHDGYYIDVLTSGTYNNDTAVITANDLTIRGIGNGRAILNWNTAQLIGNGKGILVQQTGQTDLTIENLTLQGARVDPGSNNGAGLRAQGTNFTVTNCYFYNNQDGILNGLGNVLIQYSEFAHNGTNDGQSHNLYIGTGTTTLTFQYNYTHDLGIVGVTTNLGNLFKSRANVNYILYNTFDDGSSAASYEINLPNGGQDTIIGNTIIQQASSANSIIIDYGSETSPHGPLVGDFLYLASNTVVNFRDPGIFVSLKNLPANFDFTSENNIFAGPGTFYSISGSTTTVRLDAGNLKSTTVAGAGFVNGIATGGDFHLAATSAAINLGVAPGLDPNGFSLVPLDEYLAIAAFKVRTVDATLDAGAFDFTLPTIDAVYVDSSQWSTQFVSYLAAHGLGTSLGYKVSTGTAAQLAALPWRNLDTISIQFHVDVVVQQSDLQLDGVNLASYLFGSFSYNPATFVATWILTAPIGIDALAIAIDGHSAAAVTDRSGNKLDGEWTDGVSTVSGNDAAGGNFVFHFNVLPADADRNGHVTSGDVVLVRNSQFQNTTTAGYTIFYDFNGDGAIGSSDVVNARNNQFTALPAGTPTVVVTSIVFQTEQAATTTPSTDNSEIGSQAVVSAPTATTASTASASSAFVSTTSTTTVPVAMKTTLPKAAVIDAVFAGGGPGSIGGEASANPLRHARFDDIHWQLLDDLSGRFHRRMSRLLLAGSDEIPRRTD